MHQYHDQHGRLPTAVVYGKHGQPVLSWRVAILPWIEQQKLYEEFHLDEPWDSPHNIQLLPRMPKTYASQKYKGEPAPPGHTYLHVFVGKGTAFEGREGLRMPDDFPDGSSNTILIFEGGDAVPWTEPEYIPYSPDEPLPHLATLFSRCYRVCMADASRRDIDKNLSEKTLRAAITRNGGEKLGDDWRY